MIVTLVITLFTSRIVLKALGFEDYGLYNYEMGSGTKESLRRVFSVCLTTHIFLALVLLVLAETVGLREKKRRCLGFFVPLPSERKQIITNQ